MSSMIYNGDVKEQLRNIESGSIQCCITSPPYWGLRDYGHSNQLGLEETPELYVSNMVSVFREVRRVLKNDGVLWLNLGDSYWNNFGGGSATMTTGNAEAVRQRGRHNKPKHDLFKIKDLIGIPWRVAFALQEDGWYLRQDIIWHKTNPMPESVTDRCTKAHEYVFMLTKNQRYYFDSKAIKEEAKTPAMSRNKHGEGYQADYPNGDRFSPGERVWGADGKRNKRSVWTIATKPFKGAHFAVMPEALVEPPLLATSRPGDVVLDPFAGSGTVGVVALRHQRNFVGVELNPEYVKIAESRIANGTEQP